MENFSSNHAEIYDNGNGGLMTNERIFANRHITPICGGCRQHHDSANGCGRTQTRDGGICQQ